MKYIFKKNIPKPSKSRVAELFALLSLGLTELLGFGNWGTTSDFFTGGSIAWLLDVLEFSFFLLRCLSASSSSSLSQLTYIFIKKKFVLKDIYTIWI